MGDRRQSSEWGRVGGTAELKRDRGREETGTRLLLVSVLVTCVDKGGPKLPASKVRAVAQQARRSCTIHCPQTPEGPWRGND